MILRGNKEIANYLGISPKTFITWRDREQLPYFRIGGKVLARTEDIEEWMKQKAREN